MNKQLLASLLSITLLAIMPACRKKKEEKPAKQEEINTMIGINDTVEQEKAETKKSIVKF